MRMCVCVCVCGGGGGYQLQHTMAKFGLACGKNAVLALGLNTHTPVYQPIATYMYPISPDSQVAELWNSRRKCWEELTAKVLGGGGGEISKLNNGPLH